MKRVVSTSLTARAGPAGSTTAKVTVTTSATAIAIATAAGRSTRQFGSPIKPKCRFRARSLIMCFSFLLVILAMHSVTYLVNTTSISAAIDLNLADGTITTPLQNKQEKWNSHTSSKLADTNHHNYHKTTNRPVGVGVGVGVTTALATASATASATATNSTEISVGFVHIGKTAGSTLSMLLRNGCHSFVKPKPCHIVPNETATSRLVDAYYHIPDFHTLPESNHQIYILTMRDVYDRTISSFLYQHPKNLQVNGHKMNKKMTRENPHAYRCFPTLEEFASFLRKGNSTDCDYPYRHNQLVTENCENFACAVIHGRLRYFVHLFFNYRNIYEKIPKTQPEKRIFAIRKEHIWEDWWKVDSMLQVEEDHHSPHINKALPQGGSSILEVQRNITGIELPVSGEISDEGRNKICMALELEYVAYFRILQKAENIGTKDIGEAMKVAQKNCPNLDIHSMLVD